MTDPFEPKRKIEIGVGVPIDDMRKTQRRHGERRRKLQGRSGFLGRLTERGNMPFLFGLLAGLAICGAVGVGLIMIIR